jgi:hypothetical protein
MCDMSNVIVWDIETVPDLKDFAAANGHIGKTDDDVRRTGHICQNKNDIRFRRLRCHHVRIWDWGCR